MWCLKYPDRRTRFLLAEIYTADFCPALEKCGRNMKTSTSLEASFFKLIFVEFVVDYNCFFGCQKRTWSVELPLSLPLKIFAWYTLDVIWGQPNKLTQVFFYFRISWILMERDWFYSNLSPPLSAGPQKPQRLTVSKIEYENFWSKI